jgi:hypothetical protein
MAKSMRSFPAVFVVAVLVSAMTSAATPSPDCLCHHEATGLTGIDQEDTALSSDVPAGTLQLRPRLQGVAGRIHRATGMHPAVMGNRAPTMQVPPPRQISMRARGPGWIDDPKDLTQASPRGPPSV